MYDEIDGIALSDDQVAEYASLLDDCAGDETLCKETFRLMYFSDGKQWLPMDAYSRIESDPNFHAFLEGIEADELKEANSSSTLQKLMAVERKKLKLKRKKLRRNQRAFDLQFGR